MMEHVQSSIIVPIFFLWMATRPVQIPYQNKKNIQDEKHKELFYYPG
jgi:hypothetical protein